MTTGTIVDYAVLGWPSAHQRTKRQLLSMYTWPSMCTMFYYIFSVSSSFSSLLFMSLPREQCKTLFVSIVI